MGGGASSNNKTNSSPGKSSSSWTKEEQEANEAAETVQRYATEYIVDYMYYGVPIKCGKKSVDPSSPVYIEVDPEILEDPEEKIDLKLLASVPSGVVITGKGVVTATFISNDISYTFTVEELTKSRNKAKECLGNGFKPSPPWCATKMVAA